jgi:hypothetical protein
VSQGGVDDWDKSASYCVSATTRRSTSSLDLLVTLFKPGRNSRCPCGSGRKFKHCCVGKDFAFTASEQDSYSVKIPITDDMQKALDRSAEEFRRHFEREPGSGVPLFLAKYLYSEDDVERETLAAMEAAGTDPATVYAYKKTGRIVLASKLQSYTGAAIAEWDKAIDEFHEHGGGGHEEGAEALQFDATLRSLAQEFESLIFALGLANDNYFNTARLESDVSKQGLLTATQYQALCASRVHRTLRTIRVLEEKRLSEDILKLCRSMYESYLHMVVVQQMPLALETLVDAVIGLRNGTHRYKKRKNGGDDKRFIVELNSGREIPSQISAFKMVETSPYPEDVAFFDFFYSTTSQIIHPNVFALDAYISSHGLDPVKPHMHEEAIVFSACAAAMVVDWIPLMEDCPPQVSRDCRTVVKRIRKKLLSLLDLLEVWTRRLGAQKHELNIIKSRCLRLSEN